MKFERLSRRGAGAGGRIAKRPEVEAGVGERSEAESRFAKRNCGEAKLEFRDLG